MPESPAPLTDLREIRRLIDGHGYKVSHSLGQNFLRDASVLRTILEAAEPDGEDVLEVGPGLGVLTRAMAARARSVLAFEVARRLEPILTETLRDAGKCRVVFEDFLHVPAAFFSGGPYLAVSNLPYAITTPALFRFLDGEIPWKRIVVTVQAEVAERMASPPGGKIYGALSVSAQASARVTIVRRVPSSAFWPRPKVESAIVRLDPTATARPPGLRVLLAAAFSRRRKTLRNALAGTSAERRLEASGINPDRRPETLSVEEWLSLAGGA